MKRPNKERARRLLQRAWDEIYELEYLWEDSKEFRVWRRNTEIDIKKIFGEKSKEIDEFLECFYLADDDNDSFERVEAILESMVYQINEHGTDDIDLPLLSKKDLYSDIKKVFVIHGRDESTRDMVAGFLRRLELKPVILSEQSNKGRTIIEKFEQHSEVGFAVALLTPDDAGSLKGARNKPNPRARQNVIFELGFFIGKLGRKHVCALTKGEVEIPSDYSGVLYISLNDPDGWKIKLFKELKAAGYDVDANRIMQ